MRDDSRGNSRIAGATENLKADGSGDAAQRQRGIAEAMRRYAQRDSERQATPREEETAVVTPADQLGRDRPRSHSGTTPDGDKL